MQPQFILEEILHSKGSVNFIIISSCLLLALPYTLKEIWKVGIIICSENILLNVMNNCKYQCMEHSFHSNRKFGAVQLKVQSMGNICKVNALWFPEISEIHEFIKPTGYSLLSILQEDSGKFLYSCNHCDYLCSAAQRCGLISFFR